jgi:peptidoglycan/LPS O-acetylase OafA/YrhL
MSTFRPDIEGLRALSIVSVVIYHCVPSWLPGGFVGVDVFFVISGYLITHSLLDQHAAGEALSSNLFSFWSRRARRLLPNALLVLVVVSAVGVLGIDDVALSRLGSDVAWAASYAINWLYIRRSVDYLRWGETDASVLLNFWSLAVEEQFYLLWPVLVLGLWRRAGGGERALRAAVAAGAVASTLSLLYMLALSSNVTFAFFASPARAWELLAGATLALHSRRTKVWPPGWSVAAAWVGLAGVLGAAAMMSPTSRHPGWITLAPVLGTVLLIGGLGRRPDSPLARWLASAPMRAVGARSYSIYLWHWPVLMLGAAWWPQRTPDSTLLLLAVSLLFAEIAYRLVESPARWRWGRGAAASRVLLVALVGSFLLFICGTGLRWVAENSSRLGRLSAAPRGMVGLPALATLQKDLPIVYANGCHLGVAPMEPADGCHLGPADAKAVLLFGDSHAAQWVPAVQPVAAGRGLALLAWTKSSCPSADVTIWNPAARGPYRECDVWREAVFARLASVRPALVIVSNLVDDTTEIVDRTNGRTLSGPEASAAFDAGLVRTLTRLQAAGMTVVLLRDNPRPRHDVIACLYSTSDPSRCERPRNQAIPSMARDASAALAVGVPVWDLNSAICWQLSCPVVVMLADPPRVQVVYRDDNHLTASFASSLAPALEQAWSQGQATVRGR